MAKASPSPLRYPGGKSSLYDLLAEILYQNDMNYRHYVEPFAGGCGLALSLLFNQHVSDIHINDVDHGIYSFWHSVLNQTEELIYKITHTAVTMDEWNCQKEINLAEDFSDPLKLGFSTFFLNRTNISGIIQSAGAIGGKNQNGNYKIDCRFSKDNLIKRIKRIVLYKEQIHLSQMDGVDFVKKISKDLGNTNFYRPEDHQGLANEVLQVEETPWIVTYDNVKPIAELYKSKRCFELNINYSLQKKRKATEILIASDKLIIPELPLLAGKIDL